MSRGIIVSNPGSIETILNLPSIKALDADTVYIGDVFVSDLSSDDMDAVVSAIGAYSPGGGGADRYDEGYANGKAAIVRLQKPTLTDYKSKLNGVIPASDLNTNDGQNEIITNAFGYLKTPNEIRQLETAAANEARHLIAMDHYSIAHEYQMLLPDDPEIQAQDPSELIGQRNIFSLAAKYLNQRPKEYIISAATNPDLLEAALQLGWSSDGIGVTLEDALAIEEINTIGDSSIFRNVSSFNELQYFTNVNRIAGGTFSNCFQLESITLPSSLKTIGWSAFEHCALLKHINLENVESIGTGAFYNCVMLVSIKLNAIKRLDANAFGAESAMIQNLEMPAYSQIIEFADGVFTNTMFLNCTIKSQSDQSLYESKGLNAVNWIV